jgi:hypothetical protein
MNMDPGSFVSICHLLEWPALEGGEVNAIVNEWG